MINVQNISKSFLLPMAHKRSVRGSLFSLFDQKTYEHIQVIKDFSLQVEPGEFVGVMGPNGAGKSTLLKILAGVYQPDQGAVQIDGNVSPLLELGVGFHPELTARQNVLLNGLLLGLEKSILEKRFYDIFAFAELERFIDVPLKHFSSGMGARLAFAVAIQVEADVYLLDEVLAVGDASFQEKCFKVFADLKKQGKTIVFVSHSQALVDQLCDRVVRLSPF